MNQSDYGCDACFALPRTIDRLFINCEVGSESYLFFQGRATFGATLTLADDQVENLFTNGLHHAHNFQTSA